MPSNTVSEPQWPPRSPHEALLSTPGGRERLRRMAEQGSPTPSPSRSRQVRAAGALASRSGTSDQDGLDDDMEDEDEETLRLKLQAIQARLKLKKLQNAKAHKAAGADGSPETNGGPRPDSAPMLQSGIRFQSTSGMTRAGGAERPKSQAAVEVPASPVRKVAPQTNLQTSPSRVLLGIDKGLKATDVSLKRAPSLKRTQDSKASNQAGGYLRRARTPAQQLEEQPRPVSFNERLASARTEEVARHERHDRIEKLRSTAFSVGREEMERYKTEAIDIPDIPLQPPTFSRDEVLANFGQPQRGGHLHRSNTAPSIRPGSGLESHEADDDLFEDLEPFADVKPAPRQCKENVPPSEVPEAEAASFEPYSGLHLSKRILPHQVLTRAITGKKTYTIKDLLKKVKAPNFELPDVESDVVVFAIVASKSDPRSHKPVYDSTTGKPKAQQPDRGKYMVITLIDLAFEVELFLFNTGFDRFWKLSTGTVVAVLNPTVLAPPKGREHTGRFSLVINSDADTILEVGAARDLGYCRSVKADGALCSAWVNGRRTQHCEFHTNEAVRRSRSSRIEVNMMDFGGRGGGKGRDHKRSSDKFVESEAARARASTYDRETHSRMFVSSAATLIDRDGGGGGGGGLGDVRERAEGLKRRLAAREREREIQRKLGELGGGAGRDYMRLREAAAVSADGASGGGKNGLGSSVSSSASAEDPSQRKTDARSLGLLAPKDRGQIRLSPVKRKRPPSAQSSSTAGGAGGGSTIGSRTGGLGWGGSLKDKLARMKDGEKLRPELEASSGNKVDAAAARTGAATTRDRSPVRKKTRFITEKGIREAGRESLGVELSAAGSKGQVTLEDDDDDELVIVR